MIACCVAALALAAPTPPAGYMRVSNERTYTAWSHVRAGSVVRDAPITRGRARRAASRRAPTSARATRSSSSAAGRTGRACATRGSARRSGGCRPARCGRPRSTRTRIVIDLCARRLRAYDDGRLRMSVRVAIGAPASPTPLGRFFLRERVRVTDAATSPYGPWALGPERVLPPPHRLGRRRPGRDPRHQRTRPDRPEGLQRLHPPAQRGHPAAQPARRRRHARRALPPDVNASLLSMR